MSLNPPDLGALHMEITIHDGTLAAHFETETSTAKNLLLDNLPALRERWHSRTSRCSTWKSA